MEQATPIVADQEEDVEGLEGQGLKPQTAAQMARAWLARKVRQLWLGGRAGPMDFRRPTGWCVIVMSIEERAVWSVLLA